MQEYQQAMIILGAGAISIPVITNVFFYGLSKSDLRRERTTPGILRYEAEFNDESYIERKMCRLFFRKGMLKAAEKYEMKSD